eukprot:GEMP01020997.1.p1 GENE.GEMP01020997.1~~GEMP01020997.1.p1  ORF type:complete len:231 (+),score=48.55 GEMP01020997.1:775-1467(+)
MDVWEVTPEVEATTGRVSSLVERQIFGLRRLTPLATQMETLIGNQNLGVNRMYALNNLVETTLRPKESITDFSRMVNALKPGGVAGGVTGIRKLKTIVDLVVVHKRMMGADWIHKVNDAMLDLIGVEGEPELRKFIETRLSPIVAANEMRKIDMLTEEMVMQLPPDDVPMMKNAAIHQLGATPTVFEEFWKTNVRMLLMKQPLVGELAPKLGDARVLVNLGKLLSKCIKI